jgi:cytochrome c oxidase subunit 2
VKVDAVRGMESYVWFFADEIGEYDVLCAEYCGVSHSDMTGVLRIVEEPEYRAWLLVED